MDSSFSTALQIPSHDTFGRVFSLISAEELEKHFIKWINEIRGERGHKLISIDGKAVRGTLKKQLGFQRECLHLVNIWSTDEGLVLGQIKSKGLGSAELSSAIELISSFNIEGCTVMADAGIGRASLAKLITGRGGNYLFPIKKNTRSLYIRLENVFKKRTGAADFKTLDISRGSRKETREIWIHQEKEVIADVNLNELPDGGCFSDLKTIAMIKYSREEKEDRPFQITWPDKETMKLRKTTEENSIRKSNLTRYFVSNEKLSAEEILKRSRQHWEIENKLHWVLDVCFKEDSWKVREKNAARNLSSIRRIALNLARNEGSNISMKRKLKRASYDNSFLEKLVFGS